jgi:endoglucanase
MKLFRQLFLLLFLCLTASAQNENTAPSGPAFAAAKLFRRGVNLANYLEVPQGEHWSVRHTVADLRQIRAQGFDHIRLPVAWHSYTGPAPDFKISALIFDQADEMVTNAAALGLNVIIDFHHFDEFTTDPAANTARFLAVWRQVAAHYATAPDGVAFELLNEPHDAATTAVINPIYAAAIREIRQTNPHRTIFAGPGKWNSPDELTNFKLPDDDNIIVTLHCYNPMTFTHQGATWAGPDFKQIHGIIFPGPPPTPYVPDPDSSPNKWVLDWIKRYNTQPAASNPSGPMAFRATIQKARVWSEKFGRPVHFGEFGAFTKADQISRAHYYAVMRQELESAGFGWAIWDWKSGFNYWNAKTQQPLPGMNGALFPK